MTENELTYKIRGALFTVHNTLGPGLLEKIYQEALVYQLAKDGLKVEREVAVPIMYDGQHLSTDLKLDILVEDEVIIELKSVEHLADVHKKQLLTYLKLSGKHLGYLVNFNASVLDKDNVIRIING